MGQNIFMQTATWLVSRELTEAAGPWDIRLLGDDDGEYFCRVLLASDGIRFVPDAKVYYRAFRFDSLSYIGRFPNKIEAHWLSMQLHIQYLTSLEDSPRVRAACVKFIRDSLIHFYPENTHIVHQAQTIAAELGADLGVPRLSWKYIWIQGLFGWGVTKPLQQNARRVRWSLERSLDKLLSRVKTREVFSVSKLPSAGAPDKFVPGPSLAVEVPGKMFGDAALVHPSKGTQLEN
jgi:hypothetical protein